MCHWYADSAYIYACGHPITDLDERDYQVGLKVCDRNKRYARTRNIARASKTSPAHRPIPRRSPGWKRSTQPKKPANYVSQRLTSRGDSSTS
jgi:hypothetical protein